MLIWYILIAIRAKKNRDFIYSCSQWKLSSKYNPLEESVVYWLIKKQQNRFKKIYHKNFCINSPIP